MNRGVGWYGVSYFHSFEILKALGCPSVKTYGGMSAGGVTRWMNGYDNYLSAMSNRIHEVYQIKVGTEKGLMNLKQWLHNHLDGSAVGGVASFYANAPWNPRFLPEGTPEAGKHVIVHWAGNPTHAMTITGYNDSIRYDYNEDGMYTNNLDINGDGVINMRDWEIGGMLFADGWEGGLNFGDSGKCYMMYKTLAEKVYEGGIWNNAVHVLDAKDLESPKLTAKVRLHHNMRGMLRIRCGVSSNTNDTMPDHHIDFPVFNFQGGYQFMQGGLEVEEHKTIEFGLDITPLLGYVETKNYNHFFLIVEERDPDSLGTGYIGHFSVIDYSEEYPRESFCAEDSIPIINNSATYASLLNIWEQEFMEVTTSELPPAVVGENYSFQLESAGGTDPVNWSLLHAKSEIAIQAALDTGGLFVEPENWDYGNYQYVIPFSFPYFGEEYDTIYIHPQGFIMFENTYHPWPYLMDPALMIRYNKCIAPLLSRYLDFVPAFGHGIWVTEETESLSIRWTADVNYPGYSPLVVFGLQIFQDGRINFIYENDLEGRRFIWSCGISKGDNLNYHIPLLAENIIIEAGTAIELQAKPLPSGMEISVEGVFSGTPQDYYTETEILFCAEDDDHIRAYKTLLFSATDLGISDQDQEYESLIEAVYPNPFHSEITIKFKPEYRGSLRCTVYSSTGQLVSILADNLNLEDIDKLIWDGKDGSGKSCPSGIYFVNFQISDHSFTRKIISIQP